MPRFLWLTLVKESWLLLTNAYGFLAHPYLTISRLGRDRSQVAIFASLWAGAWLGIFFFVGVFWLLLPRFLPQFSRLRSLGLSAVGLAVLFLLFFTLYLGYWWVFWRKKERICQRKNA